MARGLLYPAGMRIPRHALVVFCLVLFACVASVRSASAQETPPDGTKIVSAQVSGMDLSRLSPGLQEDLRKLVGTPLEQEKLRELAGRIESEQPRYIAAPRVTTDQAGGARVVFVVARITDPNQQLDINAKYLVEEVMVRGVSEHAITPELRKDLDALVGKPLDTELADKLETRLRAVFSDYDVDRRTVRGRQPGHIRVLFALQRKEATRWLQFDPLKAHGTYHSDQSWSARLDIPMGNRDVRVTAIIPIDTTDELIEENSGFGLRFEARRMGTERLGVSIEAAWFDVSWREVTLAGLLFDPTIPSAYGARTTFTPVMKFAITRNLYLKGGVSIAELSPLDELEVSGPSRMANTAIGGIGWSQRGKHDIEASVVVNAGLPEMESDFEYTRALGVVDYSIRAKKHRVLLAGMAGYLDGAAPMFERFALGDVRTLRGWNKYDISPTGGDRMVYTSAEYRYGAFALFVDAGSVWNDGTQKQFRVSVGGGIQAGPVNLTLGIPLNTNELRAVFTAGIRFGGLGIGLLR